MPNHWIKIKLMHDKSKNKKCDKIFLENVSVDFIKGICCALNDPHNHKVIDKRVFIKSDFQIKECMCSDILVVFGERNHFEDEYCLHIFGSDVDSNDIYSDDENECRTSILRYSELYNASFENFIDEYNDDEHGVDPTPTKQFCAFIQSANTHYLVQFDSIDFLNGFEMIRVWMYTNSWWSYSLHLGSIFDSYKVCKTMVTYQFTQKYNKLILNHVLKYLSQVLAQEVMNYCLQQCDYPNHYSCAHDECLTLSDESTCHIHCDNAKYKIRLKDCEAQVHLLNSFTIEDEL